MLIQGESGTGKELVARALHAASPRRARPFVAVNCGALPETLLESELFGHERGAFTGAVGAPGLFRMADGGTLFLDEIGELPLAMQAKLLRALQEREVRPVGGGDAGAGRRARRRRDATATSRAMVDDGRFREDLYYRLNVVRIDVPPLRERRRTCRCSPRTSSAKHARARASPRRSARAPTRSSASLRYAWPGNVRELENAIERALALARGPRAPGRRPRLRRARRAAASRRRRPAPAASTRRLRALRARARARASAAATRRDAARRLGIGRSTFYRKLARHALRPTCARFPGGRRSGSLGDPLRRARRGIARPPGRSEPWSDRRARPAPRSRPGSRRSASRSSRSRRPSSRRARAAAWRASGPTCGSRGSRTRRCCSGDSGQGGSTSSSWTEPLRDGALRLLAARRPDDPPALVVAPDPDEAIALAWFRRGAADCVALSPDYEELLPMAALEQIQRHRAAAERGAAEQRIRWLERLHEAIVEELPAGIAVVDARGRVVTSNPELARLFGVAPREAAGRPAPGRAPAGAPRGGRRRGGHRARRARGARPRPRRPHGGRGGRPARVRRARAAARRRAVACSSCSPR